MKKSVDIGVLELLQSESLASRLAVDLIRKHVDVDTISAPKNINLGFSGVQFASRSFVDSLLKFRVDLEKKGITLHLRNVIERIKEILSAVENSKPLPTDYERSTLIPEHRNFEELER